MYIFSSSPRNQPPNHGLCAGDKYHSAAWPESGGRRQVLLEDDNHHFKQQPGALVLRRGISCSDCGDKSRWKLATTTPRSCWLPQASLSSN